MKLQFILALRYLNGRKLRSFLTTLAVLFGVLVIFGLNVLLPTMLASFQATMLAATNTVDLSVTHRTGGPFKPDLVEQVRQTEGVRAAHGLLARPVNLPADFLDNDPATADQYPVLTLIGINPHDAEGIRNYLVSQGRFLQPGDEDKAVIASSLADNLGLKVGDKLAFPAATGLAELEVTGIHPPQAHPGNEEVLVTLTTAQRLLNMPGEINSIEAMYSGAPDAAGRAAIEKRVETQLGDTFDYGALSTESELFANLKVAQALFTAFGFLALFMGAFIIFNTFRTLVAERRRDLGMLRAVGASSRTTVLLILTEGLLQGVAGTVLGMLLGYLFAAATLAVSAPVMQSMLHVSVGAPVVSPGIVAVSILLGVGGTLLAGLWPALSAGRVTPLEALRPSVSAVQYRRALTAGAIAGLVCVAFALLVLFAGNAQLVMVGALLFLAGLVLIAPAVVRPVAVLFGSLIAAVFAREGTGYLAQGNLTRQPGRVAVTASTTLVALAIIVAAGEMAVSVSQGFTNVMRKSLGSDYLFIPPAVAVWGNNVGANNSLAERLREIEGVGPVSSLRYAAAVVDVQAAPGKFSSGEAASGVKASLMGIDPVTFPQVSGLAFVEGDESAYAELASGGRTIIVNGPLSSTAGLHKGDIAPLITPNGRQDYRIAAVAGDYLNTKIVTAYISQENLAADFGATDDVMIQLNLEPGADAAVVEPAIKALKQDFPQFSLIAGQEYLAQNEKLFQTAFSAIYVVFAFLAIPALIAMLNTLAISVLERTREIGMIRAVGATQLQVKRMVTAEALLLAAFGTAFGLLAGLYLGYVMVVAFRQAGFPMEFYFPWTGIVVTVAIGLLFGGLAALAPARRAARLDIVTALHYE